jgi:hypothetical protein
MKIISIDYWTKIALPADEASKLVAILMKAEVVDHLDYNEGFPFVKNFDIHVKEAPPIYPNREAAEAAKAAREAEKLAQVEADEAAAQAADEAA